MQIRNSFNTLQIIVLIMYGCEIYEQPFHPIMLFNQKRMVEKIKKNRSTENNPKWVDP